MVGKLVYWGTVFRVVSSSMDYDGYPVLFQHDVWDRSVESTRRGLVDSPHSNKIHTLQIELPTFEISNLFPIMSSASPFQVVAHVGDEEVGVLVSDEEQGPVVVVDQLPLRNDQSTAKETKTPLFSINSEGTVVESVQAQQEYVVFGEEPAASFGRATPFQETPVKNSKSQIQARGFSGSKKRSDREDKLATSQRGHQLVVSATTGTVACCQ